MKEVRFLIIGIIVLIVLLSVNIGSRILFNPLEAMAAGKTQYKVISTDKINTPSEYEKLMNDMASKGWTFDHMVLASPFWAVFRK